MSRAKPRQQSQETLTPKERLMLMILASHPDGIDEGELLQEFATEVQKHGDIGTTIASRRN